MGLCAPEHSAETNYLLRDSVPSIYPRSTAAVVAGGESWSTLERSFLTGRSAVAEIEEPTGKKLVEQGEAVEEMERVNADAKKRHMSSLLLPPPRHAVIFVYALPFYERPSLRCVVSYIPPTTGDLISVIHVLLVLREGSPATQGGKTTRKIERNPLVYPPRR